MDFENCNFKNTWIAVHLHSGSICFLLHQNRKMFNRKTEWCRLPNIDHFVTSGFSEGFVKWDDDDTDNGNAHGGVVPDGEYGADTKLFYCCRYVLQFYTNINQIAANVLGITLDNVILSFFIIISETTGTPTTQWCYQLTSPFIYSNTKMAVKPYKE